MNTVKGYKVFNPDWTCRGFQYSVGETFETDEDLSVCKRGFHFCKCLADCFSYYEFNPNNKVAEIIALGDVREDGNKCCTSKIQIVREITWQEVLTLVNTGKDCTGRNNSGDYNSGDYNSGYCNSGDYNSGYCNSGNRNSGDRNSGYCNSGYRNSGDYNSGNYNSGYRNSGYRNSGDYNSGNYNSGNYNSGDRNSGDYNSGDYNSGDWNKTSFSAGCFNTVSPKLKFFDKETDMTYEQWRNSAACRLMREIDFQPTKWVISDDMTEDEKTAHPEHKTIGGYLKKLDTSKCCTTWWDKLDENEKQTIREIPNFDAEKFYQITGIRA